MEEPVQGNGDEGFAEDEANDEEAMDLQNNNNESDGT